PIYDGLKNKPRIYGQYQRIKTAKNKSNQQNKMEHIKKRT
ncbi:UNVERIFIED_CONTAM: hypothetical protein ODX33_09660, partial [Salmonella enterica subsp. enterica serovar Typhimurium]